MIGTQSLPMRWGPSPETTTSSSSNGPCDRKHTLICQCSQYLHEFSCIHFQQQWRRLKLNSWEQLLKILLQKIDTAAPVSTSKVSFMPETSRSTRIGLTEGSPMVSVCVANSPMLLATLKATRAYNSKELPSLKFTFFSL